MTRRMLVKSWTRYFYMLASQGARSSPALPSHLARTYCTLLLPHRPLPEGVGTPSASSAAAIWVNDMPWARSSTARAAESGNAVGGLPSRTPRRRAACIPSDTSGRRRRSDAVTNPNCTEKGPGNGVARALSIPFNIRWHRLIRSAPRRRGSCPMTKPAATGPDKFRSGRCVVPLTGRTAATRAIARTANRSANGSRRPSRCTTGPRRGLADPLRPVERLGVREVGA